MYDEKYYKKYPWHRPTLEQELADAQNREKEELNESSHQAKTDHDRCEKEEPVV
jgi:hypothetical protein